MEQHLGETTDRELVYQCPVAAGRERVDQAYAYAYALSMLNKHKPSLKTRRRTIRMRRKEGIY
jgi:hypothetical protein